MCCLTFHKVFFFLLLFLLFLLGEAEEAWSKTLITPCAPGEFDFSAPRRKESSELWCTERLESLLWVKKCAGQRATPDPPTAPL